MCQLTGFDLEVEGDAELSIADDLATHHLVRDHQANVVVLDLKQMFSFLVCQCFNPFYGGYDLYYFASLVN
jgi:hypothetical protein